VIGFVGTVLGEAGVNIADMDVGQSPDSGKAALMVLALSTEVPEAVQDQLRADARIQLVRSLG
jgi:D-3-phosphoglycerate dehydrogenase